MAVRNDNKIQLREIDAKGFDVVLERRRIVSGVKQYALAIVFDEGGKAPVFGDSFVIGKRVIEDRNAILCLECGGQKKQGKSSSEPFPFSKRPHLPPPD
jgi:hypothetical protein